MERRDTSRSNIDMISEVAAGHSVDSLDRLSNSTTTTILLNSQENIPVGEKARHELPQDRNINPSAFTPPIGQSAQNPSGGNPSETMARSLISKANGIKKNSKQFSSSGFNMILFVDNATLLGDYDRE